MMQRIIQSKAKELELEEHVLDQFGKPFYQTKHLTKARRRFRLTRATLHDILNDCGMNIKPKDCLARLLNAENKIQFPLAGRRLVRFTAVARYGRFVIQQKEYDPSFFVPAETLLFARNVHWYLAQFHKAA